MAQELLKPVASMTGFAHQKIDTLLGPLAIEVKSVNSRYLEISLRLPDELRAWEGEVRSLIASRVSRGKVDCRLQWMGDVTSEKVIDPQALKSLLSLQQSVTDILPGAKQLSVAQILEFPGVLKPENVDEATLKAQVLEGVTSALSVYEAAKVREGEALALVINGYCDQIVQSVDELTPKLPAILENLQAKLNERLTQALTKTLSEKGTLTAEEINDRIRQEVLLYAIKMDVDEEMNRLVTHVQEVRRILKAGGDVGKKLDFMMQELNREANTLGSKAAAIEMTKTSLSLKVTIEKMREQVQNLQ